MAGMNKRSMLSSILQNSWLQHLVFWILSFGVLLQLFAYEGQWYKVDYIYTALFHLSLFLVVYVHIKLLIPYFLQRNNYWAYLILLILSLLAGALFNQFTT